MLLLTTVSTLSALEISAVILTSCSDWQNLSKVKNLGNSKNDSIFEIPYPPLTPNISVESGQKP